MKIKISSELTPDARCIRTLVFVEEQGFTQEFDEIDDRAFHLVAYENHSPIAVCRVYQDTNSEFHIGRLAVLPRYRGRNIGHTLLTAAEDLIRQEQGARSWLNAQVRAQDFYTRAGYQSTSQFSTEDEVLHCLMYKTLSAAPN